MLHALPSQPPGAEIDPGRVQLGVIGVMQCVACELSNRMEDFHSPRKEAQRTFDPRSWREVNGAAIRPGSAAGPAQLCCPPIASFVGAFLGCLLTLDLCASGVPPAIASATVTILLCASLILSGWAELVPSAFFSSAYGGSFGGMTPAAVLSESVVRSGLPVSASFSLLSIFCGLVFCAACAMDLRLRGGLLRGYGGRLGGLAAIASFLFIVLAPLLGAHGGLPRTLRAEVFDSDPGAVARTFTVCAIGMLATLLVLRQKRVAASRRVIRIFAAATVAFAGLVALHQMRPNDPWLLDAFYAGCFLGMSSPDRLGGRIQPVLASLVLTALLVETCPILPAVGGSLGFLACLTALVVDTARRTLGSATSAIFVAGRDGGLQGAAVRRSGRATSGEPAWCAIWPFLTSAILPRTLPPLAKGLAAALLLGAALVPFDSLREQRGESTGSIRRAETPLPAVQRTSADVVHMLMNPGALTGATRVGTVDSSFATDSPALRSADPAPQPSTDARAAGPPEPRSGQVTPPRSKRARAAAQPAPAASRRSGEQ